MHIDPAHVSGSEFPNAQGDAHNIYRIIASLFKSGVSKWPKTLPWAIRLSCQTGAGRVQSFGPDTTYSR